MTLAVMEAFGVRIGNRKFRRFDVQPGALPRPRLRDRARRLGRQLLLRPGRDHRAARSPSRGSARRASRATWRSSTSSNTWAAPSTASQDATTVTGGPLRGVDVDMNAISDTVMTLAVVALFADGVTRIRNVAHIRHKETDRIAALADRAAQARGRRSTSTPTAWSSIPPPPIGSAARIATYDDHRMAMSFALAGLEVPGRHDPRPRLRRQDLSRASGTTSTVSEATRSEPSSNTTTRYLCEAHSAN